MSRDAIDDYFDLDAVVGKYTEQRKSIEATRLWCKKAAVLDCSKDEPLPQWALDVLSLGRISYRARKYLLQEHNKDIYRFRKGIKNGKRYVRPSPRKPPEDFGAMERQSREALGLECKVVGTGQNPCERNEGNSSACIETAPRREED